MASNSSEVDQAATQYLSFYVADEEYGVGILRVREIVEYGVVTRVPSAPLGVRGVANLRGTVLPVVDLAVKMGLPETPVTKFTCIVVVDVNLPDGRRTLMGLLAARVSQVIELTPEQIEPPPSFGTPVHASFLLGMGKLGQKFLLILDVDRALAAVEAIGPGDTEAPVEPEAEGVTECAAETAEPAELQSEPPPDNPDAPPPAS